MNIRFLPAIVLAITFTAAANSQNSGSAAQNSSPAATDSGTASQSGQSASPNASQNGDAGSGGGRGQRGGRGGFGGGMGGGAGMMGRGLMGTVTEVAADHYTVKTEAGGNYVVHFTSDTRIFKQVAGTGGGAGTGEGQNGGQGAGAGADGRQFPGSGQGAGGGGGRGRGYGGGNPPQPIKSTDIKVGDTISVMGDVDTTAKSVAANRIAQLDPAVVQQVRAMEANFGKTWLMGKVTAIDGTKITLTGVVDNASYSVVADENTAFRKRRDPITLADIQVGDTVRADGAVKDGVFTATNVNVFGGGGGETPSVPRNGQPQNSPAQNPPPQ